MAVILKLDDVHPLLWDQAFNAFEAGNASRFVISAEGNQQALRLVVFNLVALKDRGIYEACLLQAYIDCPDCDPMCPLAVLILPAWMESSATTHVAVERHDDTGRPRDE